MSNFIEMLRFILLSPLLLLPKLAPLAQAQNASWITPEPQTPPLKAFSYQSKNISIADWISLFTLCLAPLLAHIIAGVPDPVCLSRERPRWHDRICQYNPTTIIWRYFAIADRRIRAKAWNAADMAASNAHFWTRQGWDGSEQMMVKSRPFCTREPRGRRIEFLSKSSIKTAIVTLQAVQALYMLTYGMIGNVENTINSNTLALDSIFSPLSIFGLMRLPAALWLTEDYAYTDYEAIQIRSAFFMYTPTVREWFWLKKPSTPSSFSENKLSYPSLQDNFHPSTSARSRILQSVLLLFLLGLLVFCILNIAPWGEGSNTHLLFPSLLTSIYFSFLLTTTIVLSAYFFLGRTATTIIPCIASMWYKIYTCVLLTVTLALVVIAALETRKSPCGLYTTLPESFDMGLCAGYNVNRDPDYGFFGLSRRTPDPNGAPHNRTIIHSFEGWCGGKIDKHPIFVSVVNSTRPREH